MLLGYNTNGLAHHAPADAIRLLAEIGYRSVALTIDHGLLSPRDPNWAEQAKSLRALLTGARMRSVIETGARYLLDYREKHEPTLVSADPAARAARVRFLRHAIDVAAALDSDCVSFWSGAVKDGAAGRPADQEVWERLTIGVREVLDYAAQRQVNLGFEPEPGMFIDTMDRYQELLNRIDAPQFLLTLDIGHLHCLGETPLAAQIDRWNARIVNVHLEDMRRGVHEHLPFGEGEIEFAPVLSALRRGNYRGGIHVELSRHSHLGPAAARQAFEFLRPLVV
ncbi:MAG TPA: sugar phosphate isomerase/epimerase family protein [Pirellulales bacterium]|jgi:sugar phosphate isomerase/epimerase|nr:sugar phosphate isomerase/epimerase family protein [Pirellulales bacterium]